MTGVSYPGNDLGDAERYGIHAPGDGNQIVANRFGAAGRAQVFMPPMPAKSFWGITAMTIFQTRGDGLTFIIDDGVHDRVTFEYEIPQAPNYVAGTDPSHVRITVDPLTQAGVATATRAAINALPPEALDVSAEGSGVSVGLTFDYLGPIPEGARYSSPFGPEELEFSPMSTPDGNLVSHNVFGPTDATTATAAVACFGDSNLITKNDYTATGLPGLPGAPAVLFGEIAPGLFAAGNLVFESGGFPIIDGVQTDATTQVLDQAAAIGGSTSNRVVGHAQKVYDRTDRGPGIGHLAP